MTGGNTRVKTIRLDDLAVLTGAEGVELRVWEIDRLRGQSLVAPNRREGEARWARTDNLLRIR